MRSNPSERTRTSAAPALRPVGLGEHPDVFPVHVEGLRAALLEEQQSGAVHGPALPPGLEGRRPGELLAL
eukprot:10823915-Alexandrium_andersonii.AAC.1